MSCIRQEFSPNVKPKWFSILEIQRFYITFMILAVRKRVPCLHTKLFFVADVMETIETVPNESPPPDVLVDAIRNRLNNIDNAHESLPPVCNILMDDMNVCHVPQHKSFSVCDPLGTAHSVRIFPKESCTCPSNSTCCHILAVRRSIGMETSRRRTICLTQLRKNSR